MLQRLTPDDLKRFHTQAMQTSRLLLVVVGDLTPEMLRPKVEAAFGTLPRGDFPATPVASLSFNRPTVQVTARDLPINFVKGVYAAPPLTSRGLE